MYLFTIDSLRADFFDDGNLPRCWDKFERDFARFEVAYANGVATTLAFPRILADDLVSGNDVLDPNATTVADLLPKSSVAVRNNVHLSRERGYHRGFTQFGVDLNVRDYVERFLVLKSFRASGFKILRGHLPVLDPSVAPIPYRPAERMSYELSKAISSAEPAFAWGHYMDPHGPYHPELVFDQTVSVTFDDFEATHEKWRANEKLDGGTIEKLVAVYGAKIRYLDRHLSGLLEWLMKSGRYEDALVVITADHGQFIGEGNRFGHDWDNLPVDELFRVPMLVKYPNGSHAGDSFDHPVQNLDIHSTIADLLDIDANINHDSHLLTDPGDRHIVAKSNAAVRGISAGGRCLKRSTDQ